MWDQANWQLLCKRLCVEMFMENKDTLLRIITLCSSLLGGKIEYNCFGLSFDRAILNFISWSIPSMNNLEGNRYLEYILN